MRRSGGCERLVGRGAGGGQAGSGGPPRRAAHQSAGQQRCAPGALTTPQGACARLAHGAHVRPPSRRPPTWTKCLKVLTSGKEALRAMTSAWLCHSSHSAARAVPTAPAGGGGAGGAGAGASSCSCRREGRDSRVRVLQVATGL